MSLENLHTVNLCTWLYKAGGIESSVHFCIHCVHVRALHTRRQSDFPLYAKSVPGI